jgi:hypothetical protein
VKCGIANNARSGTYQLCPTVTLNSEHGCQHQVIPLKPNLRHVHLKIFRCHQTSKSRVEGIRSTHIDAEAADSLHHGGGCSELAVVGGLLRQKGERVLLRRRSRTVRERALLIKTRRRCGRKSSTSARRAGRVTSPPYGEAGLEWGRHGEHPAAAAEEEAVRREREVDFAYRP